ncbi:hypothetical protein T484DRAFT_1822140 [Baffinella frigidus]|nr:hypothetical protein T484DRAFT_1822140 [Cryptophyta sp. CCMP2293]
MQAMLDLSPDCGAKALAIAAHRRGSLDNISVLVIDLRKRDWVPHTARSDTPDVTASVPDVTKDFVTKDLRTSA